MGTAAGALSQGALSCMPIRYEKPESSFSDA
jgi:hypothetical protein